MGMRIDNENDEDDDKNTNGDDDDNKDNGDAYGDEDVVAFKMYGFRGNTC